MITWELIATISVFNFVMYITPGPNNSILAASGIKFGFVKSIPNILGVPTGHCIQLALICLGLGKSVHAVPPIAGDIKIHGAAYLFVFSFGKCLVHWIFTSTEKKSSPLRYYEAILFQFVNAKAWFILHYRGIIILSWKTKSHRWHDFHVNDVHDNKSAVHKRMGFWRKHYPLLSN